MQYIDCSIEQNRNRVTEIISKLQEGVEIANELHISNLLYNEAYVALMIANILGHKFNIDTQEVDALDHNNNPVEYKFISRKAITGYTGRSFQFHWLSVEKVARYNLCSHFYFAWRNGFVIEKIICVSNHAIMQKILANQAPEGSTAGHASFGPRTIERLVPANATIVYQIAP
ncbi:MAG: hypothetical protein FJY10_05880 [Bacteroidetes bacterium]|nr:hypothetical protein [Bacteroidota bacterium]